MDLDLVDPLQLVLDRIFGRDDLDVRPLISSSELYNVVVCRNRSDRSPA
jgi:hypothetical protein